MTELVEVEITGQAITAQYGTLSTGDILRTTSEFAKHLVEDCAAAKYRKAPSDGAPPVRAVEVAPADAPKAAPKPANKAATKHDNK
ncbi:MAG: hypothetical protein ACXW2U_05430 [Telluria sp.]